MAVVMRDSVKKANAVARAAAMVVLMMVVATIPVDMMN